MRGQGGRVVWWGTSSWGAGEGRQSTVLAKPRQTRPPKNCERARTGSFDIGLLQPSNALDHEKLRTGPTAVHGLRVPARIRGRAALRGQQRGRLGRPGRRLSGARAPLLSRRCPEAPRLFV